MSINRLITPYIKYDEAEKDLLRSLEILPDQAHVLNYLAYTWIDKGIKIEEAERCRNHKRVN